MPSRYLNQCWNIFHWTLRTKLDWNLNYKIHTFLLRRYAFANAVCKMAANLSRPQCVKNVIGARLTCWLNRSWVLIDKTWNIAVAITWLQMILHMVQIDLHIHVKDMVIAIFAYQHENSIEIEIKCCDRYLPKIFSKRSWLYNLHTKGRFLVLTILCRISTILTYIFMLVKELILSDRLVNITLRR